jgi:hypothetical protein
MKQILELNLMAVKKQINDSAVLVKRDPTDIKLLAVSKTVDAERVEVMANLGQTDFAENYVQEGVQKIQALKDRGLCRGLIWHFIGPLQSNKTRSVAEHFDWVQTVDRYKIAQRLSEQRPSDLPPLQLCLQVNIDGGATKSGVDPLGALELAKAVSALPNTVLRGLMTIPDPVQGLDAQIRVHERAKMLFENIKHEIKSERFDTLSMGMSGDIQAAIAAGSTMVRVGTALFGSRKSAP